MDVRQPHATPGSGATVSVTPELWKRRAVLEGVAGLLHKGHVSKCDAVDARGRPCRATDPDACAWSLYGALLRVTGGDDFKCQTSDAFEALVRVISGRYGPRPGPAEMWPPHEKGWVAAIVMFEKQYGADQVFAAIHEAQTRLTQGRTTA